MITMTNRLRMLALMGAALGVATLSACDEGATSGPEARTTPASTAPRDAGAEIDSASTEIEKPQEASPVAPKSPLAQTAEKQDLAANSIRSNPQNLTPAELRLKREREMLEQQGVVFSDDPDAQPRLMFRGDMNMHAGTVYAKAPVSFVFNMYNGGTGDLVISRISSSCGCTVPDRTGLVDVPFSPGADLPPMKVEYTPKGPGDSTKIVTLFTNDPVTPVIRLRVGANLAPLAEAVPADIRPGELRAGREHIVSFDVMSFDPDATIQNIAMARMEEKLEFRALEPQPVTEEGSEYQSRLPVEIVFPKEMSPEKIAGVVQIEVLATPPGGSEPVVSPVSARLVASLAGDLRFSRPFARVRLGDAGTPYTFNSTLTTASGADFNITRIVATDRRTQQRISLEVSHERVETARLPTHRIVVNGITPERGSLSGELLVYTDLPNEPPVKMTFSGFRPPAANTTPGAAPARPGARTKDAQ